MSLCHEVKTAFQKMGGQESKIMVLPPDDKISSWSKEI